MSLPLVGRVEHRLELTHHSSDFVKKRDREEEPDLLNGLIFRPYNDATIAYLLVLPHHLLKFACDAARYKIEVKITQFNVIDLIRPSLQRNDRSDEKLKISLLEVGRMTLVHSSEEDSFSDFWDTASTLKDLFEFERQDRDADHETKTEPESIIATVDSISPVVAVLPTDPFCLLEIYQDLKDGTCLSSLVVIKGTSALTVHAGLHPGDTLLIRGAPRQKWTVPQNLVDRAFHHIQVPKRVIVVTDSSLIVWKRNIAAPSTNSSLEGTISGMKWSDQGCIERIDLENGSLRFTLMLAHFPMSTNLQLGLRIGAQIKAMNVHLLPFFSESSAQFYGACLRSTIYILCPSSLNKISDRHQRERDRSSCLDRVIQLDKPIVPWRFARIKSSYFFQVLLEDTKRSIKLLEKSLTKVYSREVAAALLRMFRHDETRPVLKKLVNASDAVVSCTKKRDQFAEFLEHSSVVDDLVRIKLGCHMSLLDDAEPVVLPTLMGVSTIKEIGFDMIKNKLSTWVDTFGEKTVPVGSVASYHFSPNDIQQNMKSSNNSCSRSAVCVVGRLSGIHGHRYAMTIEDSRCLLPMTNSKITALSFDKAKKPLVICSTKVLIVTVLCLGSGPKSTMSQQSERSYPDGSSVTSLCTWTEADDSTRDGSCGLLVCSGNVFIVSVHLLCETTVTLELAEMMPNPEVSLFRVAKTVEQILTPSRHEHSGGGFFGILCRQRWKFSKIKNGKIEGAVLTVAHCPVPHGERMDGRSVCSLQTIELFLSTPIFQDKVCALNDFLKSFFAYSNGFALMDEQLRLALAWWGTADGASSALIAGGFDDIHRNRAERLAHKVSRHVPCLFVPVSFMVKSDNGSVRFRCDTDQVVISLIEVCEISSTQVSSSETELASVGGQKHLMGMLDRLPLRKGSPYAEMMTSPVSGIDVVSLMWLYKEAIEAIRNSSQSDFAPSLVRAIHSAKLLSLSYCKAQVGCTVCFRSYIFVKHTRNVSKRTFWEEPVHLINGILDPKSTVNAIMQCPNRCAIDHAEVKWECSGVIDDGTSQAKLYSERQTALLLLGIESKLLLTIEQAAWETEKGISFQKAMPLSPAILQGLREAKITARQRKGRTTENDVLALMSPEARGTYLLYRHCTTSPRVTRTLDYFVRCKPLPLAFLPRQTTTEVSVPALQPWQQALVVDTATYSLPPLKLSLVDAAMPNT